MRTIYTHVFISTLVAGVFSLLLYFNPPSLEKFNSNLIDMAFNIRGDVNASKDIVVVDIDEKSLQKLGQWPWSRDKVAQILQNLTFSNVGIVGFDMVFAEEDRTSPKKILKDLNISKDVLDYDKIFADTLLNSPAILGFVFNFEQNITTNKPPLQNAIFIEKNKSDTNNYLPQAKGYTNNIPLLSSSAYSSGSFNMFSDSDGVVRYVPMLFSYNGSIYPSLTLEMIRAMLGVKVVEIYYDENGVAGIKIGDIEIPTDRYGRVFVNYRGDGKSYRYISAVDIYEHNFDIKDLEGKIVLFGTSASGLLDLRSTPFSSIFPGVEIHANVLDNIINNDFISSPSYLLGENIFNIFVFAILLAVILSFLSPFTILVVSFFFIGGMLYYFYYQMFYEGVLLNFLYPFLAVIATIFYILFNKLFVESKQKELIKKKFTTKVSPAVVDELLKDDVDLSAKEHEITIFFSDIRDFTTISEEFGSAKKLVEYLNSYLSAMSEIVIAENGTIDKYIGDAVMAYWNAPVKQNDHADMAVRCALKQLESLDELNKTLSPAISIGIGIHTGVATVGEIGSKSRSDFTVIGDSVNLCSRLEGLTKAYGARIIISEDTKMKLKDSYKIRELDLVQVKGKNKSIKIYEVLGFGEFDKSELEREKLYIKAIELYRNADFIEAGKVFEKLSSLYGEYLYKMYLQRCEEFLNKDIKDFNGVYKFVTK